MNKIEIFNKYNEEVKETQEIRNLIDYAIKYKNLDNFIIVGCCTDICVYDILLFFNIAHCFFFLNYIYSLSLILYLQLIFNWIVLHE